MSTSSAQRQLIVCGFHRSGTSLSMQALRNAGLFIGENLVPAHPSNPDGHFENRSIVKLHDEILSSVGRNWHSPGESPTEIDSLFDRKASSIIDSYSRDSAIWGFKDPRTCLFLDWWHNKLPEPGAILVYRHFLACHQSLKSRESQILAYNPQSSLFFWEDPFLGLQLWLDYNQELLKYAHRHRDTALVVSCESLMSGFDLISAANNRFDLSLNADSDSGIRINAAQHKEYRSVYTKIPAALLSELNDTMTALEELSDSPKNPVPQLVKPYSIDSIKRIDETKSILSSLEIKTSSTSSFTATIKPQQTDSHDLDFLVKKIHTFTDTQPCPDSDQFVENCLTDFPDNLKLRIAAGRYFLDRSHYPDAEFQFKSAHKLDPGNPVSLLHLGFLENKREHFLKAAHYFNMAITQQPANAINHFHLSTALINSGRIGTALHQCEKGLSIDPDNSKLCGIKIRLLIASGSLSDAAEFCHLKAISHPDEPSYYSQLAEIETLSGNTATAMHYFYLSTWLRMKATPDYWHQLSEAIRGINSPVESLALQHSVNTALKKLRSSVMAESKQVVEG